jgi:purine-binding chemotaxis protein CheW
MPLYKEVEGKEQALNLNLTNHSSLAAAGEELLIISFRVGGAFYGFETNRIQEVIMVGDRTEVHHGPAHVYGIINLRGKIVTIIDLSIKLNGVQGEISPESRILIVPWMDEQVGLLVDQVGDVYPFASSRIEPTPANVHGTQDNFLLGVYRAGDSLLGVLDLDAVLAV